MYAAAAGIVYSLQVDSGYASIAWFCESLLAFTAYIGYPKSLTAFLSQGIE